MPDVDACPADLHKGRHAHTTVVNSGEAREWHCRVVPVRLSFTHLGLLRVLQQGLTLLVAYTHDGNCCYNTVLLWRKRVIGRALEARLCAGRQAEGYEPAINRTQTDV